MVQLDEAQAGGAPSGPEVGGFVRRFVARDAVVAGNPVDGPVDR